MIRLLLVGASALCLPVIVAADQLTIRQMVQLKAPEPLYIERSRELIIPSFEEIVAKADLVVQGIVSSQRTYLSDNGMELYTDYVITPTRLFFSKEIFTSTTPGQAQVLTVKRWGGQMVVDGVNVSAIDRDAARFTPGGQVVILLAFNAQERKYHLTSDVSGILSVAQDRIAPSRSDPSYERLRGMTTAQFDAEIRRLKQ